MDDELAALYAPFGLRVVAGDITLRVLRDSDIPAYADLLSSRIFADDTALHVFNWCNSLPDVRLRKALQHLWGARAEMSPESWSLRMGVFERGALIGAQDISAKDFGKLRVVDSGSYLRLASQGRGIGTLMRQMILVLAFDHLGAARAESGAILGNEGSLAVSRHCGYQLDGEAVASHGEKRVVIQRLAVSLETFVRPGTDVHVEGLSAELLALLGA